MFDAVLYKGVEHFWPPERAFAALRGSFNRTIDELVSVPAPGLIQRTLKAISDGARLLPQHVGVDDADDPARAPSLVADQRSH